VGEGEGGLCRRGIGMAIHPLIIAPCLRIVCSAALDVLQLVAQVSNEPSSNSHHSPHTFGTEIRTKQPRAAAERVFLSSMTLQLQGVALQQSDTFQSDFVLCEYNSALRVQQLTEMPASSLLRSAILP